MVAAAIIGGSALSAGSSLLGSSMSSSAASKAADTQGKMYQYTAQNESPYMNLGASTADQTGAFAQSNALNYGMSPYLTAATANMPASAGAMTQAELEKTPGYQFTLGQGLKMTQAANAAKGLGVSGAALKGAATYATGLADQTYQNRFNEAQTTFNDWLQQNSQYQGNLTNEYNMLSDATKIGSNAAAQTGQQGTSLANAAGNYTTQAGNASAAGVTGAGNAITSGVNNYLGYNMLQNYLGGSGGTGGYTGSGDNLQYATTGSGNYVDTGRWG